MEPALTAALLWLVFGATHVGLATRRVRAALVARLGEHGFTALFSVVASAAFAVAIAYFAAHRNEGATGLALAHVAALRWTLMAVSVTGIVLVSAGSATYVGSPYDLFAGRVRAPRGIERITRHRRRRDLHLAERAAGTAPGSRPRGQYLRDDEGARLPAPGGHLLGRGARRSRGAGPQGGRHGPLPLRARSVRRSHRLARRGTLRGRRGDTDGHRGPPAPPRTRRPARDAREHPRLDHSRRGCTQARGLPFLRLHAGRP